MTAHEIGRGFAIASPNKPSRVVPRTRSTSAEEWVGVGSGACKSSRECMITSLPPRLNCMVGGLFLLPGLRRAVTQSGATSSAPAALAIDKRSGDVEYSRVSAMIHRLTRDQLYELVWSKPRTELAKQLGVSDVRLG